MGQEGKGISHINMLNIIILFPGCRAEYVEYQRDTVFSRIVVHAPIHETEAMVHAPKVSPKRTFFLNRAISYR